MILTTSAVSMPSSPQARRAREDFLYMLKHMRDVKAETSWEEAAELCKGEPEWGDVSPAPPPPAAAVVAAAAPCCCRLGLVCWAAPGQPLMGGSPVGTARAGCPC